jgi:hypothetical protein
MVNDLTVIPTTVSFADVEWWETDAGYVATGYYKQRGDELRHLPARRGPVRWNDKNTGPDDTAFMPFYDPPFSEGTLTWSISNHYAADDGAGGVFSTTIQSFALTGPSGQHIVTKYGQAAARTAPAA